MEAAVFLVDKNARIKNVNESFTKLFHKTQDQVYNELCGNAIGCIFPIREETDCGKTYYCENCELRKSIFKCFKNKEEVQRKIIQREFYIDNQLYLKFFYIIANYFQYNNDEFILVMIHDISELEKARRELKELNDLKNKFLGIVAHDLKNPIATINMASNYLLENCDLENIKDTTKLLEMIHNSSNFMRDLVDNLLDVSKIESGKLVLKKRKIDYINFLKEVLEFNKITARNRLINIILEIKENHFPKVSLDKNRIKQVLNNLVENAIKFSPEESQIIIKVRKRNENELITEIIDFGPGIPDNEINNLFKEFHTTGIRAKNGAKSTGLGLAICKKIIEKHSGEIGVKSEVGKGSTFYFSLPIN
ncbi:MAG: hypothetical protein BAJALOKI2v1_530012 [Promethearchaeota archaeon]|nr:MAG: hypothetical protein BAJALOKI2v1_530012 [Candidatus Lokiarchaeota archaeon]